MAEVNVIIEVQTISEQHGYIKGWETFHFKGDKRNRLWTIWTRDTMYNEHDILQITGELSTKAATYVPKNATEAKQIVEHSLNEVTIVNKSVPPTTQARNAADILTQKTDTDPIDMPF